MRRRVAEARKVLVPIEGVRPSAEPRARKPGSRKPGSPGAGSREPGARKPGTKPEPEHGPGGARVARCGHRGMPSRISPRPAPTSGRRPSMAGSGHPPASAAGPGLSSRSGRDQRRSASDRRARGSRPGASAVAAAMAPLPALRPCRTCRTPSGTAERMRRACQRKATPAQPLLISVPEPADARARRVHRGVCSQPAMDGRRPAVVAGRGLRPGERTPRCARRAARRQRKPLTAARRSRTPALRHSRPMEMSGNNAPVCRTGGAHGVTSAL